MTVFDIVPIEYHGMSIITAIILLITGTSVGAGTGILIKWIFDRFEKHSLCLHEHDKMLASVIATNAETKTDIVATRIVVDRIDKSLNEITRTNMEVLKSCLKRDD